MKPGKERPASSCSRSKASAQELHQKNAIKAKPSPRQESFLPPEGFAGADFFGASPSHRPWIFLWARPQEEAVTLAPAIQEESENQKRRGKRITE